MCWGNLACKKKSLNQLSSVWHISSTLCRDVFYVVVNCFSFGSTEVAMYSFKTLKGIIRFTVKSFLSTPPT